MKMKFLSLSFLAAAVVGAQTVKEVKDFLQTADAAQSKDKLSEDVGSRTDGLTKDQLTQALNGVSDVDFGALAAKYLDVSALDGATGVTLFLPTDTAFETFFASADDVQVLDVAQVLAYHVSASYVDPTGLTGSVKVETLLKSEGLQGPRISIVTAGDDGVSISYGLGSAKVTDTVVAADGVAIIHILDTVLQPPISPSATATAAELTSLVEAVVAADLVEAIDTTPQLTIFAPTNDAFTAAGEVPADALSDILTYHVVPGAVGLSFELESGSLTTLQGKTVDVVVSDDGVTVNGAKVVLADVLTENGVVHVIDAVLLPADGGEAEPDEVAEGDAATALSASGLFTLLAAAIML